MIMNIILKYNYHCLAKESEIAGF